ncbi:MAG: hypothetical protein RhofKO_17970 [Rhodothermales bacterium]
MTALHHNLFLDAGSDLESAQYRILAGLKHIQKAFGETRLYPHLQDLIQVHRTVSAFHQKLRALKTALPKRIVGLDHEQQALIYEQDAVRDQVLGPLEDLIDWGLPQVQRWIDEGQAIFDFVEEHIDLEPVGIGPAEQSIGYLLARTDADATWQVYRFELSRVTRAGERYRTMRTSLIHMDADVWGTPFAVKQALIRRAPDLPTPATFTLHASVDVPYEATFWPIAKRKLLRYLSGEPGLA